MYTPPAASFTTCLVLGAVCVSERNTSKSGVAFLTADPGDSFHASRYERRSWMSSEPQASGIIGFPRQAPLGNQMAGRPPARPFLAVSES